MPNWMTNRLFVEPSKTHSGEYQKNGSINGVSLSDIAGFVETKDDGESTVLDFNKIIDSPKDDSWYHWRIDNWGTKWNAVDPSVTISSLCLMFNFLTAWSCPVAAIQKLSSKFRGYVFRIAYFDEDVGNNLGLVTINSGNIVSWEKPKPFSMEAYQFIKNHFEVVKKTN